MDNKYQKGKIYKIVDKDETKCYIGSTCSRLLSKRMGQHREKYKKYKAGNFPYYCVFELFDEFGVENCKIKEIEHYPCNDRKELEAREGQHTKSTECVNKYVAERTDKEWREDNKESIKAKKKIYNQNTIEYRKEYRKASEEHIKAYQKQYSKKYREEKAEQIKQQKKQYYSENKNTINMKITCECGAVLNTRSKARHERTKQHQD